MEPTFTLSLVHAFDRPHPWGLRVGTDLLAALGDQCGGGLVLGERDCRDGAGFVGSLWPELGAGLAVDWRGGGRLGAQLHGAAGLGSLDVWDRGFLPYWELLATAGLRAEASEGVGVVLGGRLTKSLTPLFFTPTGSRSSYGALDGLAARADLALPWLGARWQPPQLAAGLQLCTFASTDQ